MTKEQVFEILKFIGEFYDFFEITQSKIDAWYTVLKDYDFDMVMENAKEHVKRNDYPPKVSQLLREREREVFRDPALAVPSVEETRKMLAEMEEWEKRAQTLETKKARRKSLIETAKILGIEPNKEVLAKLDQEIKELEEKAKKEGENGV